MDERDDLDVRLTDTAARWRAALPPAAEPDLRFEPERRATWSLRIPALAALATAVIVGGVWFAGNGREPQPREPDHSPNPAAVVPWAALPTTDPVLPTTRGGPSAEEIAAAPPCAAGSLGVLRRDLEGAAGTAYLSVQLGLEAPTPCRLEGFPEVVPLGPDGQALPVNVIEAGSPAPLLVTADAPVSVVVLWAVSHYCGDLDNVSLHIRVPGTPEFAVAGFGPTSCNPGEDHPAISVQPLQPGYDESAHSPYENVTVTGDLDLTVDVGAAIDFQVSLTSPVDLPLVPCPDYQILVGPRIDAHALNCAAVPHVDETGRPYLPAGVPVTFAMQAPGFEQAIYITKFGWILTAPGHPTASGTVEIGDAMQPEATVTGLVTMDGGPAGTSSKVTEGTVQVSGVVDRSAPIEAGSFELQLPAGRYDIWATSPQYGDGKAECHPVDLPNGLVVEPGQLVQVAISCQMR